MTKRNDVQKALAGMSNGSRTADETLEIVDAYARQRTTAQEIAQTVQVIALFALIGWVAWLLITVR